MGLGARFLLQTGLLFSSVSASPLGREKKNQLKPTRSDLSSEQAILQGHPHQFPQAHAPKAFRNSKVYADLSLQEVWLVQECLPLPQADDKETDAQGMWLLSNTSPCDGVFLLQAGERRKISSHVGTLGTCVFIP